ncbi:ATP-dependent protease [Reticulomyxa filosa]|uniref:ATP-dependent protease n=1 Tax=Reticulomyxa filosa TaxID=46433 RepID=X6NJ39_RETFI|nr:ATP-dependent protease [Reticulomyxa filosa]|eukprot:ETO25898.1 ATP-dependent protease [Reticulomyxa filosa]
MSLWTCPLHYLCTANDKNRINPSLSDRLQIIHLPGYDYVEKLSIAKKYLLPKCLRKSELQTDNIQTSDEAVSKLIRCTWSELHLKLYFQTQTTNNNNNININNTKVAYLRAKSGCIGFNKDKTSTTNSVNGTNVSSSSKFSTAFERMKKAIFKNYANAKSEGLLNELPVVCVTPENLSQFVEPRRFTFDHTYEDDNTTSQMKSKKFKSTYVSFNQTFLKKTFLFILLLLFVMVKYQHI